MILQLPGVCHLGDLDRVEELTETYVDPQLKEMQVMASLIASDQETELRNKVKKQVASVMLHHYGLLECHVFKKHKVLYILPQLYLH